MLRKSIVLGILLASVLCLVMTRERTRAHGTPEGDPLAWHSHYQSAINAAKKSGKMLLILFTNPQNPMCQQVEHKLVRDPKLRKNLNHFVLAKLPVQTLVEIEGKPTQLIKHPAFGEMDNESGIAIIDLAHPDTDYYRYVVSAFPFVSSRYYEFRPEYLPVILDLPAGRITQRTMIWAVRVHPDQPSSTQGLHDTVLAIEARQHSHYQASIGLQGHHRWGHRFQRIRRLLGGNQAATEVVAESWPGQNLLDSCIDCVASWRQSPGHWNAVKQRHRKYGYDICLGVNGIWYGTGIFSG